MAQQEYSLAEVSRMTGIAYWRIYHCYYNGTLPEPRRVGRMRVYTDKDVQRIREHFTRKGEDGTA